MNTSPPPSQLLAAFNIDDPAQPLPGGQGTAWGTDKLVLKPLDMSREQMIWQEQTLHDIRLCTTSAKSGFAWPGQCAPRTGA
jgi:hypothetical protein